MQFDTPLLFMVFNRPAPTERVFEEIRKLRPARLFIAADGPRPHRPEDAEKCRTVRAIVSRVDWPCEVKTLYRDKNLGCKIAVSSAITWFFNQVEEGIVLEDDCLPDQSFFPYCAELLTKYRNNKQIMMISGFNTAGYWPIESSYFFSKYSSIWGWATWRRAWQLYDIQLSTWQEPNTRIKIRESIASSAVWKSKKWIYDRLYSGIKNTWDYQWEYAMFLHQGLNVVPIQNLIENIGFDAQATHTNSTDKLPPKKADIRFPLQHPSRITPHREYDTMFAKRYYTAPSLVKRIVAKIFK